MIGFLYTTKFERKKNNVAAHDQSRDEVDIFESRSRGNYSFGDQLKTSSIEEQE